MGPFSHSTSLHGSHESTDWFRFESLEKWKWSEVCSGKTPTLSLNPSMVITVRCFDRDIMPLYCRQSHLKALPWWTDASLWMDATVPVLKMDISLPAVYFSVSLLFAWEQWLLLHISFTLHLRSVSWKWQTVGTTGRMRTQLDLPGALRQMGRTDCLSAHWDQQLICNDCLDLVADSLIMTNMGEQSKIKWKSISESA